MTDKNFEKIMDDWARRELENAPMIKPTEQVYEKVRARQKQPRLIMLSRPMRWATAGVAIAAVILFAMLNPELLRLAPEAPGIGLRKGIGFGKGELRQGKGGALGSRSKGEAKTKAGGFSQLLFQYQRQEAMAIATIDIPGQQDASVKLSSRDNYRLQFLLDQERYVYVYQLDSKKGLIKLFPNENNSSALNPLQVGQSYLLPQAPNWFFLTEKSRAETIYIVASPQRLSDLEKLYDQYVQEKNNRERKNFLSQVMREFEVMKTMPETGIYEFRFQKNE